MPQTVKQLQAYMMARLANSEVRRNRTLDDPLIQHSYTDETRDIVTKLQWLDAEEVIHGILVDDNPSVVRYVVTRTGEVLGETVN